MLTSGDSVGINVAVGNVAFRGLVSPREVCGIGCGDRSIRIDEAEVTACVYGIVCYLYREHRVVRCGDPCRVVGAVICGVERHDLVAAKTALFHHSELRSVRTKRHITQLESVCTAAWMGELVPLRSPGVDGVGVEVDQPNAEAVVSTVCVIEALPIEGNEQSVSVGMDLDRWNGTTVGLSESSGYLNVEAVNGYSCGCIDGTDAVRFFVVDCDE